MLEQGYYFKSRLFNIEPNEDEATNPFRYGKQLAEWIAQQFEQLGYNIDIINEDWGYCVMLKSKPYLLWVGCGNQDSQDFYQVTETQKADFLPNIDDSIWGCFVAVEIPLLKKWSQQIKLDSQTDLKTVNLQLEQLLKNTKGITLVDE